MPQSFLAKYYVVKREMRYTNNALRSKIRLDVIFPSTNQPTDIMGKKVITLSQRCWSKTLEFKNT